jgi:hypothetical protein
VRSAGVSVHTESIWTVWFPTNILNSPLLSLINLEGFWCQSMRYPLTHMRRIRARMFGRWWSTCVFLHCRGRCANTLHGVSRLANPLVPLVALVPSVASVPSAALSWGCGLSVVCGMCVILSCCVPASWGFSFLVFAGCLVSPLGDVSLG